MPYKITFPDEEAKTQFDAFHDTIKAKVPDSAKRKAMIDDYLRLKGWQYTYTAPQKTGLAALPQAFKVGSLGVGRAMVKSYQAIGMPLKAPMPSIPPTPDVVPSKIAAGEAEFAPTGLEQIPRLQERPRAMAILALPSVRAEREKRLEEKTKEAKLVAEKETEERFKSTQDIVDYYDTEIEGIKKKYKESLLTKTVESLPLSLSALVATMANPAIGAAYTGYVFGGSSAQDLLDKAFQTERQKPVNSKLNDAELRTRVNDAYKTYAAVSGAVQAGGEYAGNLLLSKFIPGANPIKNRLLKAITTMLAGGTEEAVTETGQEAGTIITERAAKLPTGALVQRTKEGKLELGEAGRRLWDSFSVGGLSGILLGGIGGAGVLTEKSQNIIKKGPKATPEERAIVVDEVRQKDPNYNADYETTLAIQDNLNNGVYNTAEDAETDLAQIKDPTRRERVKKSVVESHFARMAEAETDELTKIPGPKAFSRDYAEAQKTTDNAIIEFDIDKFKAINDTYGHATGDKVLIAVAGVINNIAKREGGAAHRKGGEEMTAIVPAGKAIQIAEEIRTAVEGLEVDGLKVTISGGIARFEGTAEVNTFDKADKALYRAKKGGRNRVEVDESMTTPAPQPPSGAGGKVEPKPQPPRTIVPRQTERIVEGAIKRKLTEEFGDLPEMTEMKMAEQAQRAAEIMEQDIEAAKRMAMGQEAPPMGVQPESMFAAMKVWAFQNGDAELIRDLATKSSIPQLATVMGQRIKALDVDLPGDPVRAIQRVNKAKQERAAKKYGDINKAKTKNVETIKAEIKRGLANPKTWQDFVNSIKC